MQRLQTLLEPLPFEELEPNWRTFDLKRFSLEKQLRDYQKEALRSALKALWHYYQRCEDYHAGEDVEAASERRKACLWQWYQDHGLPAHSLDLKIDKKGEALLGEYYGLKKGEVLPFAKLINRMSFWMATGSGKSLVLIKLIELLWQLMERGEIPSHDILVLTVRDDLLAQLEAHVAEYNRGRQDFRIELESLKKLPERKRGIFPRRDRTQMTVFYYRADNLSDVQKERLLDFRSYENGGRWYILLDEAHKGDQEDSKRQHIYTIMSRHGFLFNFSATFTDARDLLTTVYDFNLSRFVAAGYSKHLVILQQESVAFRRSKQREFSEEEKRLVVLKALLILAYVRSVYEALPDDDRYYHRPLMLTLVNSVNTRRRGGQPSDLQLFFQELERIGREGVPEPLLARARRELWEEWRENPPFLFEEGEHFVAERERLEALDYPALLRWVYNADAPAQVEVLRHPTRRKEMAFKLKSSDAPFALIKIGDISHWLREVVGHYEHIETYDDESFFTRLNAEDSPINLLLGSRSFYEGWDSNRPNLLLYINIGTRKTAKKFILQSVGRGVRIEPLPGLRQRLQTLYQAQHIPRETFERLRPLAQPLETLFIMGTKRDVLAQVIEELKAQERTQWREIALQRNPAFDKEPEALFLVPLYRKDTKPIFRKQRPRKFHLATAEMERLRAYLELLDDDRLLLLHHPALSPADLPILREVMRDTARYFQEDERPRYPSLDVLLLEIVHHFRRTAQLFDRLAPMDAERGIRHYLHVKVDIEEDRYFQALQNTIQAILTLAGTLPELIFTYQGEEVLLRYVARHYYIPLLKGERKVHFMRYVITYPSELRFLRQLEETLQQERAGEGFHGLDWWAFSRIEAREDTIYIPYYDANVNQIRDFYPDFVFWLRKGEKYAIVFVDPKGSQQASYEHKVDGFEELFTDGQGRPLTFDYQGLEVRFFLRLYTKDKSQVGRRYRPYWIEDVRQIAALI